MTPRARIHSPSLAAGRLESASAKLGSNFQHPAWREKLYGGDPYRQQGVTLVVALIFLVVLTLLGITAAQNSGQEERMAGNTRNRDLAFQAAEATLSYVEKNQFATIAIKNFGTDTGYLAWSAARDNDASFWSSYNWAAQSLPTTGFGLGLGQILTANQPQYVVEKMNYTQYVAGPPAVTSNFYRVTVRSKGADPNAVVILQAVYKYP